MSFAETHLPCSNCPSSNALCRNDDGSTYCFSCLHYEPPEEGTDLVKPSSTKPMKQTATALQIEAFNKMSEGNSVSISDRRISAATADKFGVVRTATKFYFPYSDANGTVVAAKIRDTKDKAFSIGVKEDHDWKDATLFGQQLFPSGGKYITIVEGEFDALACYQMLGSKYPVVSIRNGAGSALKDCTANYEWLDSFETVVINFDGDEQGRKAAEQVSKLFSGKSKVMKPDTEYKDACDWLSERKEAAYVDRWWKSETTIPDGIVAGSSLWEEVSAPVASADCFYPWKGLNDITYGIRKGELVTVTAGSGLGKSQVLREIVWHIVNNSVDNIGLMFLEESVKKTALSLMSLAVDKQLHLPNEVSYEEKRKAFDLTMGTDRLYMFDHFGSTSIDNIVSRVRYMAKGLSCGYVFLDHLSIIVSAQDNGDERKAIDEIMTKLRMLVQETGIALIIVSHLKRPVDRGHEEGAATSLAQLRGSAAIAQLSDMVIGLERNGQAADLDARNTTQMRVLKNRFNGITGPACKLKYDHSSGRMFEVEEQDESL
mgnify:CR=1 FL=1